jgi:hypothetical protein
VKEYPPTHVAEHTTVHPSIVFALTALGVAIIATMNSKPFKESKPTPKQEQGINSTNIASLGDTHMGGQKSSETLYANAMGMSIQSMQSKQPLTKNEDISDTTERLIIFLI